MKITLTVFGFEVARIELAENQDQSAGVPRATVIESGVDWISGWWVNRMMKRKGW